MEKAALIESASREGSNGILDPRGMGRPRVSTPQRESQGGVGEAGKE